VTKTDIEDALTVDPITHGRKDMPNTSIGDALTDQPLAGRLIGEDFDSWPGEIRQDFLDNEFNGEVGNRLLSESDRVRVWEIRLQPGQRVAAHRHVLDYFWTAINPGSSRQHTADGTTREVTYEAGQTRHFHFAEGEYLLHDLENVGDTELVFSTVEFLDSANPPLPLD
jgi:quercetin dioxygenase-like cupin family protein